MPTLDLEWRHSDTFDFLESETPSVREPPTPRHPSHHWFRLHGVVACLGCDARVGDRWSRVPCESPVPPLFGGSS